MKKGVIFLCFVIMVLVSNIVLSQDNITKSQEQVTNTRAKNVMIYLKWMLIFAIIFVFLLTFGGNIFRKIRRSLRRKLLYIFIFFIKRKNPDKQFIREKLIDYGFKTKHVYDATHRYEKRWGLKK